MFKIRNSTAEFLIFQIDGNENTGAIDACDCDKIMQLISEGKIDTTHLITHRYPLSRIQEAYTLFANRADGIIKTAIHPNY